MSGLTEAQFELFERLTERPFLVLDTEYCNDPDREAPRIISIGITPIVRGKRTRDGELYVEMNPGVPIDEHSTAIHEFTDEIVARKRRFTYYAPAVVKALSVPDAVLVTHTGVDVGALRRELERLDEAADGAAPVGLADLPDLPIVDTSTLPALVRHPVGVGRGSVSLESLCAATGVTNTDAHNARADARATADALIGLLLHAAKSMSFDTITDLLADHDRGTTQAPRLPLHIKGRRTAPPVPAAHLARHVAPLTHPGSDEERAAWLELATACVQVRCEHLRAEARLAAPENAHALLPALTELLPDATEPGQPGTLLGALAALLEAGMVGSEPPATEPALRQKRAMFWWRRISPSIAASAPCTTEHRCPDCWDRHGCPRDTLYQPFTRLLVYGDTGELTRKRVKDTLFGSNESARIHRWSQYHPQVAAYMTWLVATWAIERNNSDAGYLDQATAKGIYTADPRLALLVCERTAETAGYEAAKPLALEALSNANTDPAYDELRSWATWQEQTAEATARRLAPRTITHPRLARPDGRVNPNPYLPNR